MSTGSVYNVYLNGRPSGLPVDIVDQLVQVEQTVKLTPIEQDISDAQDRKDIYTSLNSKLVDLYSAADTLNNSNTFQTVTATSSDTLVATVSASSNSQSGTYSLTVSTLAQADHQLVGVDDSNPGTGVTLGVSDPDDASLIADGTSLNFYHEGTLYTYTTDSSTTLSSLADEINNADNGVIAQALNIGTTDSPQYVLSLKSQDTGSGAKQITTDAAGTSPGVTLSATLFEGQTTEQEQTQAGVDASFNIDGVDFTRSSNTLTDVISGLTINLQDTGSTQIDLTLDTDSITQYVLSFINAFNAIDSFMDQNADYDSDTQTAGPLLGDSIARTAQNQIMAIIGDPVSGTTTYQYLSEIGIQRQEDGTLSLDSETFQSALSSNRQAVEDLFVGDNGVAGKLVSFLEDYTNSFDGVIPSTINTITEQINDLNDDYTEAQNEIQDYEDRMNEIYNNLELAVMKYQSIGDQLSAIIDTWDTSSNS